MAHPNGAPMPLRRRVYERFFTQRLDFRIRFFNVLAFGGALISLLVATLGVVIGAGAVTVVAALFCAVLAVLLVNYAYRSGRYQLCYMITISAVFLVFFPIFFFASGGYHSGMPSFFVFAVLFTVFMLDGVQALVFSVIELVEYVAVCVIARQWPQTVNWFASEASVWFDTVFAFVAVSIVLSVCLYLHFRIFRQQQSLLGEHNAVLTQTNRMKTEFLSNASHEMRTPLTVTSVNVQTVLDMLEDMDGGPAGAEAARLLEGAQAEIMRLSRMVSGMLTLASMSEDTDRRRLDLASLLRSVSESLRLSLHSRDNRLEMRIDEDLIVFGNADLLAQALSNILQNAGAHTQGGVVSVRAYRHGAEVVVTVRDTGVGIPPDILPHVFERGISTGGTGFGLYLCKAVVESHGGKIWIESAAGSGTAVHYTLPLYEGQLGGT